LFVKLNNTLKRFNSEDHSLYVEDTELEKLIPFEELVIPFEELVNMVHINFEPKEYKVNIIGYANNTKFILHGCWIKEVEVKDNSINEISIDFIEEIEKVDMTELIKEEIEFEDFIKEYEMEIV
jgi:hypothetical protein